MNASVDALTQAKRAAWDLLAKRGWLGIAVPGAADPDFHLAMRYRNQLGLVFVAADSSSASLTRFDRTKRERLLACARQLRGMAIVARCTLVAKDGGLEAGDPGVESLMLEDVATAAPLDEKSFDTSARIEISDWEVLDFAIQHVRNALEKTGYRIESFASEPGSAAHIVARKDNTVTRVVVAGARYPAPEPAFDRDRLMSVAETTLLQGGQLAKAAVTSAHAGDPFTGDDVMPLYRGEPVFAKFSGIEVIDPRSCFRRPH